MSSFWVAFYVVLQFTRTESKVIEHSSTNCRSDYQIYSVNETFPKRLELSACGDTRFDLPNRMSSDSRPWITDIPNLPILFATSPTLPNGRCRDQVRRYRRDLSESILWASEMFDASTKYPSGFIYGHTKHLGNFDQCYELSAKLSPRDARSEDEEQVEGRYCLVRVKYRRKNITSTDWKPYTLDFDPNSSVWEALEDRRDFRRGKRDSILSALCVPATCGAEDVELALKDSLKKWGDAHDHDLSMSVDPMHCQARKDSPQQFSTSSKILCLFSIVLCILVVASSWYDSYMYSEEEAIKNHGSDNVLLSFSFRRNLRTLLDSFPSHRGLDCLHLCRFLLMSFLILGHGGLRYGGTSMQNMYQYEKFCESGIVNLITNPTAANNGFFAMAGIILAHSLIGSFDRGKGWNLLNVVLTRMWRLTPLYAFAICIYAFVLPQLGHGPYWPVTVGVDEKNCPRMWWVNLLYLSNYVAPEQMCMYQSWFFSVDFQLHVTGSFVLWIFWKLPRKLGYSLLVSILVTGLVVSSFEVWTRHLRPFWLLIPEIMDPRVNPYFTTYYIRTHNYVSPYILGMITGVIMYDLKASPWKLPKIWSRLLLTVVTPVFIYGTMYAGYPYTNPNYDHESHLIQTALFASLHRLAIALGYCSIPLLIRFGSDLDSFHRLLAPRWVAPLASLSYGVSLFHPLFQNYDIGSTRSARTISVVNMIRDAFIDIVFGYGLSLIVAVSFEYPCRKIGNFIVSMIRRNSNRMSPKVTNKTS